MPPPIIQLRIPVPWMSSDEFAQALESPVSPYKFHEGQLVHRTKDWRCECDASPHDDELAESSPMTGGFRSRS